MRTISECAKTLKTLDSETAITYTAIRRMVLTGEIEHTKAGNKRLINFDNLLAYLTNPPTLQAPKTDDGGIRPIGMNEKRI